MLGEGDRDKAFLEHLCTDRSITGLVFDYVGGNGGFGKRLQAMSGTPRFEKCESILLMSDYDEVEDGSFEMIREQLKEIDFPVPSRPLITAHKEGRPSVAILMQPYPKQGDDETGCLETLLIPAIESAYPREAACVNDMLACSGVTDWKRRNARDKAKVRCLVSAVYSTDPMHGLHLCFSQDKKIIPLKDKIFDETALVLRYFVEWSSSPVREWGEWRSSKGI